MQPGYYFTYLNLFTEKKSQQKKHSQLHPIKQQPCYK